MMNINTPNTSRIQEWREKRSSFGNEKRKQPTRIISPWHISHSVGQEPQGLTPWQWGEIFNQPIQQSWFCSLTGAPWPVSSISTSDMWPCGDSLETYFQMAQVWGSGLALGLTNQRPLLALLGLLPQSNSLRSSERGTLSVNLHLVISWDINQSKR